MKRLQYIYNMKYNIAIINIGLLCIMGLLVMGCVSYKRPIKSESAIEREGRGSKKYGYIVANFNLNAIAIGDNPNLILGYTYKNSFRIFGLYKRKHIFKIKQFDSVLYPVPKVTPIKPKVYKVKAGTYAFYTLAYKNKFANERSKYNIKKNDDLKYVYILKGFPKEFTIKPDEVLYLGDVLFTIDQKNINTRITDNFDEDIKVVSEIYDFSNKTITTIFKNDDEL